MPKENWLLKNDSINPSTTTFQMDNDWVKYDLMPKIVDKALELAESKLEDVLKQLDIKEVVREQVDSFPIEKLEEIV